MAAQGIVIDFQPIGQRIGENAKLRREVEDRVEAGFAPILVLVRVDADQEGIAHSPRYSLLANQAGHAPWLRQVARPVNKEQGTAGNAQVTAIGEGPRQPAGVLRVVFAGIGLPEEDVLLLSQPSPRPGLVGPGQAEGEVGLTRREDLVKRPAQQAFSLKPVVPVAEGLDPVGLGQAGLLLPHLGNTEIVEPKVGREVRLIVAGKLRPRLGDVAPLREPFAPPGIVLRNGMELRQVKGDQTDLLSHGCRAPRSDVRSQKFMLRSRKESLRSSADRPSVLGQKDAEHWTLISADSPG